MKKEDNTSILNYSFLDESKSTSKSLKNIQSASTLQTNQSYSQKGGIRKSISLLSLKNNISGFCCSMSTKILNRSTSTNIFEKGKKMEILKKRKIEILKSEQFDKEMAELKPYVKMSKKSKQILMNKFNRESTQNVPIYLREHKISKNHTLRLINLINNQHIDYQNKSKFDQKKFQNFLDENKNFVDRKNQKINELKQKQFNINNQHNTFVPKINQNSKFIADKIINNLYTDEELIHLSKSYIKKEARKLKEKLSFKPITCNSKK